MTTFHEFMQEIENEAVAEGPEAEEELRRFHEWYAFTRKTRLAPVAVREHPLVAEYLVTVEAPSQSATDEDMAHAREVFGDFLNATVDRITEELAQVRETRGYSPRIDRLATGISCGSCSRPVIEQIASAARSTTHAMEAVALVEKHRTELMNLLNEVVSEANCVEDPSSFVLWVQERLHT